MTTFIQATPAHDRAAFKLDTGSSRVVHGALGRTKQLKRLPHVFCKWLDLPFAEETNVEIEETRESYKFAVRQPGLSQTDAAVEAVEIVPGAVKVMLRGQERIRAMLKNGASNNWRARLPACAMTEAATSSYAHGVITIIIPKQLPSATPPPPPPPPPPNTHHRCGSNDVKRSLLCLV